MKRNQSHVVKVLFVLPVLLLLAYSGDVINYKAVQEDSVGALKHSELVQGPPVAVLSEVIKPVSRDMKRADVEVKAAVKKKVSATDRVTENKVDDVKVVKKEASSALVPSSRVQRSYLKLKRGLKFSFITDDSQLFNHPWRASKTLVSIRLSN